FLRTERPFLVMSPESAEMTKYAANAMLATKISFINEIANLCEALGADINEVRRGIGHDARIGFQFLFPGAGFGGSCFPKDIRAQYGDRLIYCDRPYGALEGADGLVVVTEWQEFRHPDFEVMRRLLREPVLFDGRNLYEPKTLAAQGFTHYAIGRATRKAPA